MTWLKQIIFVLPVAAVAFFAVAFLAIWRTDLPRENALVMGSIGEPRNINPIRASDASAGDITDLVFNGLVKVDENLNIVGDLATSWELSQSSRVYFDTAEQAEIFLQAARSAAERIRLISAEREGNVVRLGFKGAAGSSYFDVLAEAVERTRPQPVWIISIRPLPNAKFADGTALYDREKKDVSEMRRRALEVLGGLRDQPATTQPDLAVVHTYTSLGNIVELVGHGDLNAALGRLNALFNVGKDDAKPLADISSETFVAWDQPAYRFNLRQGVRWQTGEIAGVRYPAPGDPPAEFTADDVVFTWESIVNPEVASPRAADFIIVESAKALDPHTVEIVYKRPYSSALVSWAMSMLPKHVLASIPIDKWADTFDRRPLGTGPFKMDEWVTGERIRLVRNDDYFDGPANLDAIYVRYIPDPVNIKLALETGEIDFYSIKPYEVARFEKNEDFELFQFISRAYNYIGWNLKRPMFQDVRVRRAMAHAINVEQFIDAYLSGYAIRSTGIYTPQFWFANDKIEPIKYDPAEAKRLLAEAGWKDTDGDGILDKDGKKFQFTIITNAANEDRRAIAVIAQDQLRRVGIDVNIETYEWGFFIQKFINTQDFDACILGWSVGIDYDMYQLWHSSQTGPGDLNFISYKSPEADRLIGKIRSTYEPEKVAELTHELQRVIYDDQPYLFMYVPKATVAMKADTFRVYRPLGQGQWKEEPIRQTPAGFSVYLPYWYRTDNPPAALKPAAEKGATR